MGWVVLGIIAAAAVYAVFVYNGLVGLRQRVNQAFADIDVQLKQRHDLIPNLVETVKGYAAHERETLEAVVAARAAATQIQVNVENLTDPQVLEAFQNAQAELTGALSRLLAVVEAYPDLKASQNFLALQAQLEGTENRIAVARRDYIEAVRVYNTSLRTFPTIVWTWFWYTDAEPFATFTIPEDKMEAPKVDFGAGGTAGG
jgi:LemA protein